MIGFIIYQNYYILLNGQKDQKKSKDMWCSQVYFGQKLLINLCWLRSRRGLSTFKRHVIVQ